MKHNKNKKGNFPNLRFPEFEGEWEENKLGEVCIIVNEKTSTSTLTQKTYISTENIEQDFMNTTNKSSSIPVDINVTSFQKHDILLSNIRPYLRKTWLANINGGCSADVFVFRAKESCDSIFLYYSIANERFINYVMNGAKGVKMPRGDKQQIIQYPLFRPSLQEQQRVATFLTLIDKRIETQRKIIEDLESLKGAIRDKIFTNIENTSKTKSKIKNVLNYEQPTKYIVESTDYSENTLLTPVLTANKAFILGYIDENSEIYDKGDSIIFDDFTMDMKYVTFPYKVKSSAIKILTSKNGFNLLYVYEYLQFLKLESGEHKRHYISEIQLLPIPLVKTELQLKIGNTLFAFDEKTRVEYTICNLLEKQKQFLLRKLFI